MSNQIERWVKENWRVDATGVTSDHGRVATCDAEEAPLLAAAPAMAEALGECQRELARAEEHLVAAEVNTDGLLAAYMKARAALAATEPTPRVTASRKGATEDLGAVDRTWEMIVPDEYDLSPENLPHMNGARLDGCEPCATCGSTIFTVGGVHSGGGLIEAEGAYIECDRNGNGEDLCGQTHPITASRKGEATVERCDSVTAGYDGMSCLLDSDHEGRHENGQFHWATTTAPAAGAQAPADNGACHRCGSKGPTHVLGVC